MNVIQKLSAAALLSIGFAGQAQAALITYNFTGTVFNVAAPLAGAGISVGSGVSGTFTLDTSIADIFGTPLAGMYLGISGSVTIGGYASPKLFWEGLHRLVGPFSIGASSRQKKKPRSKAGA
ncbi:MAG: hypothetical protein FJX59_00855 [Alphaproteobacteria bacterium]|nr:hypothetical protein [Alphaproteobacteria bacterium]